MIDIHIHILPGIDDGSRDFGMSLQMADIAVRSGVTELVTTPHCMPGMYENYVTEELRELWQTFRRYLHAEGIPLKIYTGMEIFAQEDLPLLIKEGRVWTMNRTKYFLIEFDFGETPAYCDRILTACAEQGYRPIIAHPERYYFVQSDPGIVYRWYRKGYGIQLNMASLLGKFGENEKRTGDSLMRHGLVNFVASDAHRTNWRSPDMSAIESYLLSVYGEEYTHMVLYANPARMLDGRKLLGYQPLPY